MIEALRADGAHPDVADHFPLFGQFIGSWDLERTSYAPAPLTWALVESG